MPGKMSPEERRRYEKAQWARNTRDFEAMYERLQGALARGGRTPRAASAV